MGATQRDLRAAELTARDGIKERNRMDGMKASIGRASDRPGMRQAQGEEAAVVAMCGQEPSPSLALEEAGVEDLVEHRQHHRVLELGPRARADALKSVARRRPT
eukprot:6195753-Pleurochrysis_carterae.AAC.4